MRIWDSVARGSECVVSVELEKRQSWGWYPGFAYAFLNMEIQSVVKQMKSEPWDEQRWKAVWSVETNFFFRGVSIHLWDQDCVSCLHYLTSLSLLEQVSAFVTKQSLSKTILHFLVYLCLELALNGLPSLWIVSSPPVLFLLFCNVDPPQLLSIKLYFHTTSPYHHCVDTFIHLGEFFTWLRSGNLPVE
jgi:hypothetical protein